MYFINHLEKITILAMYYIILIYEDLVVAFKKAVFFNLTKY